MVRMASKEKCGRMLTSSGERFLALFLIWRLSKESMYGYRLIGEVRDLGLSAGRPSTLYLVLSRLETKGLIKSHNTEVGKRVRKMYRTTQRGAQFFQEVKKMRVKGRLRMFLKELLS